MERVLSEKRYNYQWNFNDNDFFQHIVYDNMSQLDHILYAYQNDELMIFWSTIMVFIYLSWYFIFSLYFRSSDRPEPSPSGEIYIETKFPQLPNDTQNTYSEAVDPFQEQKNFDTKSKEKLNVSKPKWFSE